MHALLVGIAIVIPLINLRTRSYFHYVVAIAMAMLLAVGASCYLYCRLDDHLLMVCAQYFEQYALITTACIFASCIAPSILFISRHSVPLLARYSHIACLLCICIILVTFLACNMYIASKCGRLLTERLFHGSDIAISRANIAVHPNDIAITNPEILAELSNVARKSKLYDRDKSTLKDDGRRAMTLCYGFGISSTFYTAWGESGFIAALFQYDDDVLTNEIHISRKDNPQLYEILTKIIR